MLNATAIPSVRRSLVFRALPVMAFGAMVLAACGDDTPTNCVATLCDPATFVADCDGHQVRRCDPSGKRYTYQDCASQQYCSTSSGAAVCVPRVCTTIGVSTCLSPTQTQRCNDDGSARETADCAPGDTCRDGQCVPTDCTGLPNVCTTNGFLHCDLGQWTPTACDPGEVCLTSQAGVRCAAPICTPEARGCDGTSEAVCDARGTSETKTACSKTESCVDGRCVPSVCGQSTNPTDVSDTTDTSDVTDTETTTVNAQIKMTLDGVLTVFEQNAKANYDSGPNELVIQAAKSQRKFVIHLVPIDPTKASTFDSTIFSPTHIYICYADGISDGGFLDCGDGFSHKADAWLLTITHNDGPGVGGRLQGTFKATLRDKNTLPTEIVGGTFDVPYR